MLDFECPHCHKEFEIEGDNLPDFACDDVIWECPECDKETKIGWYAVIEER
ncbi:hypothetical protein MNBD_GAMMA01-1294 [hydrothermal vent metagenome]|uniref:CPXCG motif-containing cysteine-rich protein n=1 Tax=hydrothermal vent metagenome TaxID=652676 RepID=A0A3B0VE17_9ZZZZ